MTAARQATATEQATDLCNSSYWSGVVKPRRRWGDHLKPQDVDGKIYRWSPGQPQFTFYRVTKKKEDGEHTSQYNKNSHFGGDRVTTPSPKTPPCVGFEWSPHLRRGLTTPDHPHEVTL